MSSPPPSARALACSVFVMAGLLSPPVAADAPALVVVAGPATGRQAAFLSGMTAGARRAAAMINARAANDASAPVSITEVDDGCDARRARGAAAMIVALKPDLVIGHPCPSAAIAAAPVYAQAGIVFIALGVRHPALTQPRAGPTIFRLEGRDDRQGEAAARALSDAAPNRRVAIVQDRTAYARAVLDEVTAALAKTGVSPMPVLAIVAGRRDYDAEIARIMAARPDAVFFAGYPSEAIVLLRGLRRAGLGARFLASDANATPEFAEALVQAGLSAAAVHVLSRMDLGSGPRMADAQTPTLDHAAKGAVEVWAAAVRTIGSREPSAVATALLAAPHETSALGDVAFESTGDARLTSFAPASLVAGRWSLDEAATR